MNELETLRQRVGALERHLRWAGAVIALLAATGFVGFVIPEDEVLRVRGIVVTDAAGRERIVLGAPMSESSSDPRLAATSGVVVLDSLGLLNVCVGTNNPLVMEGGRLGKRIHASAGMTIYDPRDGKERGGIGAFTDGRANICLDYGSGSKEAACIAVAPGDEYAAVILNGTPKEKDYDRVTMFLGADGTGAIKVMGGNDNNGGVMMTAGNGPAKITVYDTTGTAMRNLLE
jgi:hypothetical protein